MLPLQIFLLFPDEKKRKFKYEIYPLDRFSKNFTIISKKKLKLDYSMFQRTSDSVKSNCSNTNDHRWKSLFASDENAVRWQAIDTGDLRNADNEDSSLFSCFVLIRACLQNLEKLGKRRERVEALICNSQVISISRMKLDR